MSPTVTLVRILFEFGSPEYRANPTSQTTTSSLFSPTPTLSDTVLNLMTSRRR
jgi:hypothetical protein